MNEKMDHEFENTLLREELVVLRAAVRAVTKSDSDDAKALCSELRVLAILLNTVQKTLKEFRERKLYELESEIVDLRAEIKASKKIISKLSTDEVTFDKLFPK